MKMPYLKFYTRDWLSCPEVRMCSYQARGLWIDMMCLMATSRRYGYLENGDGNPVTVDNLARLTGGDAGTVKGLLGEMRDHNVYSTDERGCIFSRRMVRDNDFRSTCSAAGKRGGNPLLTPPLTNQEIQNPESRTQNPHLAYPPPLRVPLTPTLNPTLKGVSDSLSEQVDSILSLPCFAKASRMHVEAELRLAASDAKRKRAVEMTIADAVSDVEGVKKPMGLLRSRVNWANSEKDAPAYVDPNEPTCHFCLKPLSKCKRWEGCFKKKGWEFGMTAEEYAKLPGEERKP